MVQFLIKPCLDFQVDLMLCLVDCVMPFGIDVMRIFIHNIGFCLFIARKPYIVVYNQGIKINVST